MEITTSSIETTAGPSESFTGARGVGLAQPRGGPVEVIHPGDRVFFEPGEDHWHGAAATRFMTHLAMLEVDDEGNPATWGDDFIDEEYPGRRRSTTDGGNDDVPPNRRLSGRRALTREYAPFETRAALVFATLGVLLGIATITVILAQPA
jgi:hypothetical protein